MQIDIKEASRLFSISEREMLRWIERRDIPAHQVQDHYMFNRAELVDWARANGVAIGGEASGEEQLPSLSESLADGGISRMPGGDGKEQAIRDLVGAMPVPPRTDRDSLFNVLMAREQVSSTGIGDGIAIPHVRSPLILNTETPLVNLCLLKKPIDFGAMDGKPVHALFTMITPNARMHLHLISRLAMVLRSAHVRDALKPQSKDQDIIDAIASAEAGLASKRG